MNFELKVPVLQEKLGQDTITTFLDGSRMAEIDGTQLRMPRRLD